MPPLFSSSARRRRAGFTLIELLTVVAIIGVLAAILLPTISRVRSAARQTQDLACVRGLGQAMMQYAAENHGIINAFGYQTGKTGQTAIQNSFFGRIWPYLKDSTLMQLNAASMQQVASDYISPTINADRPDLIANTDGINHTISINQNLFTPPSPSNGSSSGSGSTTYTAFSRMQNIPRPSVTPYIVIGKWGFWDLTPSALPTTQPQQGVYWAYEGQRTALVYLDGHAEITSGAVTSAQLKALVPGLVPTLY